MKLWEIFRFELVYQVRRGATWLYFPVLTFFAFAQLIGGHLPEARSGGYFLGAPFVVASVTVFCCLVWLLAAAYVAGSAAARDVEVGLAPLAYTAPVSKADYLGGRFLAAFLVNALILLAVPAGILLGLHAPEVEAAIRGPCRFEAFLGAYAFIAVPNAFIGTAIEFSSALWSRRAIASYLGALLLLVVAFAVTMGVSFIFHRQVGTLLDPMGLVTIRLGALADVQSPIELNGRRIALEGELLANRLLWLGVAVAALAFAYRRFRFVHPGATSRLRWLVGRRRAQAAAASSDAFAIGAPISMPRARRVFGVATRARQALAIAWTSFRALALSPAGLLFLTVVALFALASAGLMELMGVPVHPSTDFVLFRLTNPEAPPMVVLVPLLIVFWSGELVWREREAGVHEIVDAAPVSNGVLLLGKLLGLGLILALCMALQMAAGIFVQLFMGYHDLAIGLYLQVLFGLQLADYLLLAVMVLVVHAFVSQKYVGHLVVLTIYGLIAVGVDRQVGHPLFVPGSGPEWSHADMRGFGPNLVPWLWFKLYWTAWALLGALLAKLLWVRGREGRLRARLRNARRGFTRWSAGVTALAAVLVLAVGGFIFYNTSVVRPRETAFDRLERSAEYERRYGRYAGAPQPRLRGTSLRVEIYPEQREVEIGGTYRLVNDSAVPIDTVHVAVAPGIETGTVSFDRPATLTLSDDRLGHRIYALEEPLQPADSLRLGFQLRFEPRGFPENAVDASVVANGTLIPSQDWLPAIGYQPAREVRDPTQRRLHGLDPRPAIPSLYDEAALRNLSWTGERTAFEAVVGTAEGQVGIAPGVLRQTWTEGGRRYFRYSTDAAIANGYRIASADYAVHEGRWQDVAIQIYHHPAHTNHLEVVLQSARASLNDYTKRFGPYPYSYLRFVERPGPGGGLHADTSTITYREWFTLMNTEGDPSLPNVPFAVVAHEVGHQWWGGQLRYALVEGAGVLSESLAWYSAMGVVENTYGREQLHRLLRWMREQYPTEPENVPLLRAADDYLLYRKGPFAIYALSEYIGRDRVDQALRRLLAEHRSGEPPLPTTLDLYRELRAATPDSLRYLLRDLFERNTSWELETERATAEREADGRWRVRLDVRARKTVVDEAGQETALPIGDWVQVGVFPPAAEGTVRGDPLYLGMHHIEAAEQTITVAVPQEPASAGIDPYHLLDWRRDDNVEEVKLMR